MCYVIENFYKPITIQIYNNKLKHLFFFQNIVQTHFILMSQNQYLSNWPSSFHFQITKLLFYFFYSQGLNYLIPLQGKNKKSWPVNTFQKTLIYWTFRLYLKLPTSVNIIKRFNKNTIVRNYSITQPVFIFRKHKIFFKNVILVFLLFIFSAFQQFNHLPKIQTRYFYIHSLFTFLPYYNNFFFKIHQI